MQKLFTSLSFKVLFIALFMSLTYSTAQAQIWNNIGSKVNDKLKKKADQKVEEKIDQAIDKSFDKTEQKIEESFQKEDESTGKSGQTGMPGGYDMSSMFGGAAEVRDEYKFDFGITYKTSATNSKGKTQEVPSMTMWMAESGITAVDVTEQNSMMIIDMEKESMVIIQNNEKTYMAIKSNMKAATEKILESQEMEDITTSSDAKIEKIGTENLLGYKCDIYKITSDGKESKVWVTQEIAFDYSKMAGGFSNSFGGKKQKSNLPNMQEMPSGMLLKMISNDPANSENMSMIATEVFKNGTTIKMSSYKKLGM